MRFLLSGMHIQREYIHDITRRAHLAGKVVALGGPSVSSAPEYYPEVDLLHCGEVGDGTRRLFERLDETIERPAEQMVFQTVERLPMAKFPTPAYDRIDLRKYLLGSVQFSSGCPFTCEFCDIPALYGRNPRLKNSPRRSSTSWINSPMAVATPFILWTIILSAIPKPRRNFCPI